jgi:DeoR/GlpR family transcriptional regulator of sugar metabolism
MLARQRQERILDEVRNHGGVRVGDLVELLQVSDMTVRRDIESLARRGLVERVHGGATTIGNRSSDEPGFVAKSSLAREEKRAIAREAVRLVEPVSPSPSPPARPPSPWRASCSPSQTSPWSPTRCRWPT